MTDIELGESVIKSFYAHWSTFPAARGISYAQLLNTLKVRRPMGGTAFLDGIGLGVRSAGMSQSKISNAMRNLAMKSNGKIPAYNMDFFTFLSNESVKINFIDAAAYVVVESGKDIIKGAQEVGDSLISAGKFLNFVLPAVAVLFVFFWLDKQSEGKLSKLAGKASKALR